MSRLLFCSVALALFTCTGCGGSAQPKTAQTQPDIEVKLEGTWQGEAIVDETEAAKVNPVAVQLVKSMKMEMTFRDDGTLSIVSESNGKSFEDENRWDYVDQDDNKLTIKSIAADGKEENHEFFFNSSNSFDMPLLIETAQVGALRFTRVR
jgi:hypothetical protein